MFNWDDTACQSATSRPSAKVAGKSLTGDFAPDRTGDSSARERFCGCRGCTYRAFLREWCRDPELSASNSLSASSSEMSASHP